MRSPTQQLLNITIANGQTKSAVQGLYDNRIAAIAVPAGSSLNGLTAKFLQIINGSEYEVRKADGTAFSVTLTAGQVIPLLAEISLALSEFKLQVSAAPTGDGYVTVFGYSG